MTEKKAEQTSPKESAQETAAETTKKQKEFGGPSGLEPTRYGDWERKGIISDF